MDERAMEENVTEATEAKTEYREASTQPFNREAEFEAAVEVASNYEDTPVTQEEVPRELSLSEAEEEDDGSKSTVVGVSSNGKKMIAKVDPVYAGYVLAWSDGGVMPKELGGRWTNIDKARIAATVYLNSK